MSVVLWLRPQAVAVRWELRGDFGRAADEEGNIDVVERRKEREAEQRLQ